jgi:periplasmic divalent cation tolerance protein
MTDKLVVFSTSETEEEARTIAHALVEGQLAACVNIVPGLHSVYRWKGAVEEASEVLLIIKTSRTLFGQVRAVIERIQSYELPEVIALPIVDGSERYLEWLSSALATQTDVPR